MQLERREGAEFWKGGGRRTRGTCHLSWASVLCPSKLVTHISVLFYRKLGIDHIKNTKVIIVSRFYHKTN